MTTYLLDCGCGNKVPVEIGQAGGRVTCTCGAQLDVPTLRNMRHLPVATVIAKPTEHPVRSWGTRQGAITACMIILATLLGIIAWSRWTQPVVPKFDAAAYQRMAETQRLSTPADAWFWWIAYYRPLAERGFSVLELANRPAIEHEISRRQFFRRILWVVAAISAATAATVAYWPRFAPRR